MYTIKQSKMLDDNWVTRWLSKLCEETFDDQEQWMKLIEFLKKDLTVQHQMLIQEKSDEIMNSKQNSDGRQIGKNGARFTNQCTEKKCHS